MKSVKLKTQGGSHVMPSLSEERPSIFYGLKQQNIHKGHDFLMDVSDPTSPNYGNHWTPEQVRYEPQKGEIETDNIGC